MDYSRATHLMYDLSLNDRFLHNICDSFDFSNDQHDSINLSNCLNTLCHQLNGVGLAANQVGLNLRVIAVKGIDSCLFNPHIVSSSDELEMMEEGCLSFPGLAVKIKRPKSIRVRYQEASGEVKTNTFVGLTSRIIQHEIDHLDGILFYTRANLFHKEQAMRKWKNVKQTYHI